MESGAIPPVSVAPAAAIAAVWSDSLVPLANVTMYGTGVPVCAAAVVVGDVVVASVEVVPYCEAAGDVSVSVEVEAVEDAAVVSVGVESEVEPVNSVT
jgi:uncharacterized protein YcsI (UPF0317 family)